MIHEYKGYHINISEIAAIVVKNPEPRPDDVTPDDLKVAVLFAGSSTAKIELNLAPTEIEYKKLQELLDAYYEYHDLEE